MSSIQFMQPRATARHRLRRGALGAAIGLAVAVFAITPARAQDTGESGLNPLVDVAVDEARVVRLNRPPATIVVGNPLIADALIQESGIIFLVGRNYGTTNMIALDDQGQELANYDIVVRTGGRNAVSLFRGTDRVALNCSPRCEAELDVGDGATHFDIIRNQLEAKTTLSQSQAETGQ
jgi:hypothetical protein